MALNYGVGRQAMMKGVTSYDDDVWLVSYPKSGNTWTRFLIANLISGGRAVGWSNIEQIVPDIYVGRDPLYRALPRPRYFKSHDAYRPEYRRVIFIVRDPRDVAVSYYHYVRKSKMLPVDATMDDFMSRFLAGTMDAYGSWGENIGSWLGARQGTPDFTIVRYEDLLADTVAQLSRVAEALHLSVKDSELARAVENSKADRMRQSEEVEWGKHKQLRDSRPEIPFVRAAKSGQWQTELPPESARQIEAAWGHSMRQLGYL